MRNILLIILLSFLWACGYSPVYKNQNTVDFKINIIDMQGDKKFNNQITSELNLYSNLNSTTIYDAKIKSDFNKNIISKNAAGVATNYLLTLLVKIEINSNNKIKIFEFEENMKIVNNSNSFEQSNYENNIKRNFASIIREKLLIQLINLNDN